MTRHQRLQHTLASPVRCRKQLRNRKTRQLRRDLNRAFDKVIRPQFPDGYRFTSPPAPTPQQRFRQLLKAKRREKREATS
jgi:hypothetical protein